MIYIYTGLNIHKTNFIRVKCTDPNVWTVSDGNVFIPMKARHSPLIDGGVHPKISVERMASIIENYKTGDIIVVSCCNPDIINFMGELVACSWPADHLKIVLLNEDNTGVVFNGSMTKEGYLEDGWPFGFFNYEYEEMKK